MARARVLVVDDSAKIREVVSIALQQKGYEVMLVGDGQEAIEWLAACTPDLVLTDLHMPRVDGLGLLQYIKAVIPSLPVILWTTDHTLDAASVLQEHGAAACLSKSKGIRDVLTCIARLLA